MSNPTFKWKRWPEKPNSTVCRYILVAYSYGYGEVEREHTACFLNDQEEDPVECYWIYESELLETLPEDWKK